MKCVCKITRLVLQRLYCKILKYTKVGSLNSNPFPIENTCAFAFSMIQYILGRHFLRSF